MAAGTEGNEKWDVQAAAVNSDGTTYSDIATEITLPRSVAPVLLSRSLDGTTIIVRVIRPAFPLGDTQFILLWGPGSSLIGSWGSGSSINVEIVGLTSGSTNIILNLSHDQFFGPCESLTLTYTADRPQAGDGGPGEGTCLRQ